MDAILHILGFCSDSGSHPSLLMLLSGGVGFGTLWAYIKFRFSKHKHSDKCGCDKH